MHRTRHTPNILTTYSFVSGLLATYCLWHRSHVLFALFGAMGYVFDCMDGQFARRYDMVTTFGDVYDHVTDITVWVLIMWVVVVRRQRPITVPLALVYAVFMVLCVVNLGCQQRQKPDNIGPETIDTAIRMCHDPDWIRWTRFFGPATANLVTMLFAIYLVGDGSPPPCRLGRAAIR